MVEHNHELSLKGLTRGGELPRAADHFPMSHLPPEPTATFKLPSKKFPKWRARRPISIVRSSQAMPGLVVSSNLENELPAIQ